MNGHSFNPDFLITIDDCIREKIIKSPDKFDKPLFLVKFHGHSKISYYIRLDYLKSIFDDLKTALSSNISPMLKMRCEKLIEQIKFEYSMNGSGGSSLEKLTDICKKNNLNWNLTNSFNAVSNL